MITDPIMTTVQSPVGAPTAPAALAESPQRSGDANETGDGKLREVFGQFVGEAFFGQLIKAMRSSLGKPAYFHGGRAEEVFQGQLDQVLSERIASVSADRFAEPMYELFTLQRRS